jgi:ketosteroid isomerase-like protein
MIDSTSDIDRKWVIEVADEEAGAMAAGDMHRYGAILADDAVFMPPNSAAKIGVELRQWLGDFLEQFSTEWLALAHGETVVVGDFAFHDYTYSMRFTPRAGGEPGVGHGKGLHVLRRQPDGSWKIVRNVWNAAPPP